MGNENNPVEALNQAITEKRLDGAEKNTSEIISKILGVPIEVVNRVLYAGARVEQHLSKTPRAWREVVALDIPEDDRDAIDRLTLRGARRFLVRMSMEKGVALHVSPQALISRDAAHALCAGCPSWRQCYDLGDISEGRAPMSTPQACYDGFTSSVLVTPIRLRKTLVDVSCERPAGDYTIHIDQINLK